MSSTLPSWAKNLERYGGFWRDQYWYDLHVEERMPQVAPMLKQLILAAPPLGDQHQVCDLCSGNGIAGIRLLEAYPEIKKVTFIENAPKSMKLLQDKLKKRETTTEFEYILKEIAVDPDEPEAEPFPGAPYDLIVGTLALHSIVGHDLKDQKVVEMRYEALFKRILASLKPGGHLLVGDHVGALSLGSQMRLMSAAGVLDVDCAWRDGAFFVSGGRKPPGSAKG